MLLITKGPEPPELRGYRATPGNTYDGANFTPVKDAIRAALLRDQKHLCCYCMRRISAELRPTSDKPDAPCEPWMKVEHWRPQEHHRAEALLWRNLLGACWGGKSLPHRAQHCDARKGEAEVTLDPQNPGHIHTLSLGPRGKLLSSDPILQRDIDDTLNLNHPALREERSERLDGVLAALRARHRTGPIPIESIRRLADELETPRDGALPAHCGVVRLYLRKRFRGER